MIAASSATDGSEPSSCPSSATVSESPSGARAIVCAPFTRVSAPAYPGGFAVEVSHTDARAEQLGQNVEGNVAGMRLAERPEDLDSAPGRQRCCLARRPRLADPRRSHDIHDTTAATGRAFHKAVE